MKEKKVRVAALVDQMLQQLEDALNPQNEEDTPPKASLADLIRLIQLHRELEEEEVPEEITVKWIEPSRQQDSPEK